MGCCGKKREAWKSQGAVKFRYTGNRPLDIRSNYSRRIYHFSIVKRTIEIPAEDVPAMRNYALLVEIKE